MEQALCLIQDASRLIRGRLLARVQGRERLVADVALAIEI